MLPFKNRFASPAAVSSVAAAAMVSLAIGRIHLRAQTTLVGYQIGQLKSEEGKLLEERSTLKMQLAKMTSQKHLLLMTESTGSGGTAEGTYALK